MQIELTAPQRAFQREVRRFVAAHWPAAAQRPGGPPGTLRATPRERAWHEALLERGWTVPHWPRRHGGCDWSPVQHWLWEAETARAEAPAPDACSVDLAGPLIMALGTPAQQRQHLPVIREAGVRWCWGATEREAGSDHRALAARATPRRGGFRLTGEKTLVAGAAQAGWMLCPLAIAAAAPGEAPLVEATLFMVPLDAPGVAVSALPTLDGGELYTITLDDVAVGAEARLGEPGSAWPAVAQVEEDRARRRVLALRYRQWMQPLRQEPAVAAAAAELEVAVAALEALELRVLLGDDPAVRVAGFQSLLALRRAAVGQRLAELQVEALGYYGLPCPDALLIDNEGPIGHDYALAAIAEMLRARGRTIDGGTSEIHKNDIARSVLGF